jgi:hypothetical protein
MHRGNSSMARRIVFATAKTVCCLLIGTVAGLADASAQPVVEEVQFSRAGHILVLRTVLDGHRGFNSVARRILRAHPDGIWRIIEDVPLVLPSAVQALASTGDYELYQRVIQRARSKTAATARRDRWFPVQPVPFQLIALPSAEIVPTRQVAGTFVLSDQTVTAVIARVGDQATLMLERGRRTLVIGHFPIERRSLPGKRQVEMAPARISAVFTTEHGHWIGFQLDDLLSPHADVRPGRRILMQDAQTIFDALGIERPTETPANSPPKEQAGSAVGYCRHDTPQGRADDPGKPTGEN